MNDVSELLKGVYDLHVHTAPSVHARYLDDIELLILLEKAGMGGATIKSHYECTASRAMIANKYFKTQAKLYGCLALNASVGGWNPSAVDFALQMGTKNIFAPTNHAKSFMERSKSEEAKYRIRSKEPLTLLDENGAIRPEVYEILDLVKQYDAIMQTGHLSETEGAILAKEALSRGIKTVITHPDSPSTRYPLPLQLELARAGAFIDISYRSVMMDRIGIEELTAHVKELSPERCIVTTDLGQKSAGFSPVEGFGRMFTLLLEHGISEKDIRVMAADNTRALLGL